MNKFVRELKITCTVEPVLKDGPIGHKIKILKSLVFEIWDPWKMNKFVLELKITCTVEPFLKDRFIGHKMKILKSLVFEI